MCYSNAEDSEELVDDEGSDITDAFTSACTEAVTYIRCLLHPSLSVSEKREHMIGYI